MTPARIAMYAERVSATSGLRVAFDVPERNEARRKQAIDALLDAMRDGGDPEIVAMDTFARFPNTLTLRQMIEGARYAKRTYDSRRARARSKTPHRVAKGTEPWCVNVTFQGTADL